MKIYLKFIPLILWGVYFFVSFNSSLKLYHSRLRLLKLSREMTVGGFSHIYDLAAFVSFLDEALLLIVAITAFYLINKKFK